MAYKPGESVIVTQDGVNRVGTVLDQYVVNKQLVYDVLLEKHQNRERIANRIHKR
jgi:hypothetical protein